jgi:DNA-binding NtrC family response regulator
MLPLSSLISHVRTILYRIELMRESGSFAYVKIQLATAHRDPQEFTGLLTDVSLISEVSGVVGLELKLASPADTQPHIDTDQAESWVTFEQLERDYLLRVLEHTKGNKQAAARILGVDRTTVNRKIHHYNIRVIPVISRQSLAPTTVG